MTFTVNYTPIILFIWMGFLWWRPGKQRRARRIQVVLAVMSMLMSLGISALFSSVYYRPRPFVAAKAHLLIEGRADSSFPSRHTTAITAIATILARRGFTGVGSALWSLAWLVIYARVYVGIHYPSDVLAGALVGWVTGVAVRENSDALLPFANRMVNAIEGLLPQ